MDRDARPYSQFAALPDLTRSARQRAQQQRDPRILQRDLHRAQYKGKHIEVRYITAEDGVQYPATIGNKLAVEPDNDTLDYAGLDAVSAWYGGIIDDVTVRVASVRFPYEDVTKELNLFVEKEGRRILDTYMPLGKAWRIATR